MIKMTVDELSKGMQGLLVFVQEALNSPMPGDVTAVETTKFYNFRYRSISFLTKAFGPNHVFTKDFSEAVKLGYMYELRMGLGILQAAKEDIDHGWLLTVNELLSADIFKDFLQMAYHLLTKKYFHAAAVMIGCVLEGHIHQLAAKNGIAIFSIKSGKMEFKSLSDLNAELYSRQVYQVADQQSVTSWYALRTMGAHFRSNQQLNQSGPSTLGLNQLKAMHKGVSDFIDRIT